MNQTNTQIKLILVADILLSAIAALIGSLWTVNSSEKATYLGLDPS